MKVKHLYEGGIIFDNGTRVYYEHEQECCEVVYADFKQLEDTTFSEIEHEEIIQIGFVYKMGFTINNYFVPCYNSQNGYYSDELKLIIEYHHLPSYQRVVIDLNAHECIKEDIE